ncbi:MAG: cob(I)alamin adenosyltransferase [Chloroflexota bacterium]|nr:cob(I)alamin adenosyltransferase [Chloroflexota bacterium]
MNWFFSGKGDRGKSSLMDGATLEKDDPAFELIGTLDEANAALGLALSFSPNEDLRKDLLYLQTNNSALMGVVAGFPLSAEGSQAGLKVYLEWIEERIRFYGGDIENPRQFVFPGGTSLGAALDLARTIIRRAERRGVVFRRANPKTEAEISAVLNRLSSLLFLMRLYVDQR